MDDIQKIRKEHWDAYYSELENWATDNEIQLPVIPSYATNNGHMFYLICKNVDQRTAIIDKLKSNDILAVFHYISLHSSPFFQQIHCGKLLSQSDRYSDCLLRLSMYYQLNVEQVVITLLNN